VKGRVSERACLLLLFEDAADFCSGAAGEVR
jgi:hypothetical protein